MNLGQAFGELQLRIMELEDARVVAAPAEPCPVCAKVRELLGIGANLEPMKLAGNQHSMVAVRGIASAIRATLRQAREPMSVREISRSTGLDTNKVATNIPHLMRQGGVTRTGERGFYRYQIARVSA